MVYGIVNGVMLHSKCGLQNCEQCDAACRSVVCGIVNGVILHSECGLENCEQCDVAHRM